MTGPAVSRVRNPLTVVALLVALATAIMPARAAAAADVTPPTVTYIPLPVGASRGRPFLDKGWNSDRRHFLMDARDSETSLASRKVRIDNTAIEVPNQCWDRIAWLEYFCDVLDPTEIAVYTSELADGPHQLELTAVDDAANQAVWSSWFSVDNQPPTLEAAWVESATEHGWTHALGPVISWQNGGESTETITDSGVRWLVADFMDLAPGSRRRFYAAQSPTRAVIPNIADGIWKLEVRLRDRALNIGDPAIPLELRIDRSVLNAPTIDPVAWISREQLAGEAEIGWVPPVLTPHNISGICGFAAAVSDSFEFEPAPTDAVAGSSWMVEPGSSEGTHYLHVRAISCAGKAGLVSTRGFGIDKSAPSVELKTPAEIWTDQVASISAKAADSLSGVRETHLEVDGEVVTALGPIVSSTLGDGTHTLAAWAIDNAGNTSPKQIKVVRVDLSPPSASFSPVEPADPTSIRATVRDDASGLTHARIEYREAGGASHWRTLGDSAASAGAGTIPLQSDFPDTADARLFELRIVAQDRAGNTLIGGPAATGSSMRIATPLRRETELRTGLSRACGARRRCDRTAIGSQALYTDYGRQAVLRGRLADGAGLPVAHAAVAIREVARGGSVRTRTAITRGDGLFTVAIAAGVSREVTVSFGGSRLHQPAVRSMHLETRPRIRLALTALATRSGPVLWARGRVASGGAILPVGEPVAIQIRERGRWRQLGIVATQDDAGQFVGGWSVGGAAQPIRFRLRAVIEGSARWPFASGRSRVASVVVRPTR